MLQPCFLSPLRYDRNESKGHETHLPIRRCGEDNVVKKKELGFNKTVTALMLKRIAVIIWMLLKKNNNRNVKMDNFEKK